MACLAILPRRYRIERFPLQHHVPLVARRATGRPAIISFRGAFHGRTVGATSITSSALNYRRGYEPLMPSIYQTVYPAVYRYYGGDEDKAVEDGLKHFDGLLAWDVLDFVHRPTAQPELGGHVA